MISRIALIGIASLAIAISPAHAVGKKKNVSWGKPGVSLIDYSADSLECSNKAYGVHVVPKPYGPVAADLGIGLGFMPAAVWIGLTPRQDGPTPFIWTTTYIEGYKHAMWMDVVEQLQAAVDSCLVERGYHRFRLTPQQMSVLRRLKDGTPERQTYLHSLGSSPDILASQSL